jgi:uncharacterized protein (DUF4415 family)
MSEQNKPVVFDEDNPEWTEADFARAKRGKDIPEIMRLAFGSGRRGRPAGSVTSQKTLVSLRIDNDVLARFKATGAGWQTRINEALRRAKVRAE